MGAPFRGVDSTRSAIVVAAGEYDLDRPGATVMEHHTETELEVSWHAPLFGSEEFSDVAVVLGADGSVGIKWEHLDLCSSCRVSAGLRDAFGADNLDLSAQAMAGRAPSAVSITPFVEWHTGVGGDGGVSCVGGWEQLVEVGLTLGCVHGRYGLCSSLDGPGPLRLAIADSAENSPGIGAPDGHAEHLQKLG